LRPCSSAKEDEYEEHYCIGVSEDLTVDGVMESPETWAVPSKSDDMAEVNQSGMATSDALLLGRVTYQALANYWPKQPRHVPLANYNQQRAQVRRLHDLGHGRAEHSTLIKGKAVEQIAKLKQQPGKNISILGSATLVQSLLRDDLLDELVLMVHPIILGSGKRLFTDESAQACQFTHLQPGVVYLTYQPDKQAA
jgi:dihydrofolate reductase